MFLASHICCVSSGTVSARYCCDPREVKGANPTMKKWSRGNGIKFTASFRRSEFSWPGNLKQQVTPLIVAEIRWFKSPTGYIWWNSIVINMNDSSIFQSQTDPFLSDSVCVYILTTWGGELESSEADIIECFIVKHHTLIGILHQLMNRKRCIVRLYNCVGYLWRREDWKCKHHPIWVLFSNLWNEQSSHSRPRSTSKRMTYLKS